MINVTVLSLLLCLNFPRGKMKCDFFTLKKTSQTTRLPWKNKTKTKHKNPTKNTLKKIRKLTTKTTLKNHGNEDFFLKLVKSQRSGHSIRTDRVQENKTNLFPPPPYIIENLPVLCFFLFWIMFSESNSGFPTEIFTTDFFSFLQYCQIELFCSRIHRRNHSGYSSLTAPPGTETRCWLQGPLRERLSSLLQFSLKLFLPLLKVQETTSKRQSKKNQRWWPC